MAHTNNHGLSVTHVFLYFIQAYTFKDKFRSVPNPNLLKYYNDESEYDDVKIIYELLKSFRKHINFNEKLINDKVAKGQDGFDFLKISGMFAAVKNFTDGNFLF